ncbi:hypothetical protein DV515_00011199, partial [Chloebia gouldiae]
DDVQASQDSLPRKTVIKLTLQPRVFSGLFLRKPHKGLVSCESGELDYVPIVCLILPFCMSNGYYKDFSLAL